MKRCPHCLENLPISAFNPDAWQRNGLSSYCKKCRRSVNEFWRQKNLEISFLKFEGPEDENPVAFCDCGRYFVAKYLHSSGKELKFNSCTQCRYPNRHNISQELSYQSETASSRPHT